MVGTWRAKTGKRGVSLALEPFEGTVDLARVGAAAERYAAFLGKDLATLV